MSAAALSDEYHKSLALCRSKSGGNKKAPSQWIQDELPTHISLAVREVPGDQPLRVLAIASGPGDPDVEILELLLTLKRPIQYTVVDPNKYSVGLFKENVTKNPCFGDIEFKFFEQTIESFLEGPDCAGPYHLIHIISALCYLDDVFEIVIQTCVNLLTTYGIFFTAHHAKNEGFIKVYNNNRERRFGPSRQMYLMENMERVLEQLRIRFSKEVYKVFYDVDVLFAGQSEEADLLLDAFTEVTDVRNKAPSLVQPLLEDIKKEKILVNGKMFLKGLYCVYTMMKA